MTDTNKSDERLDRIKRSKFSCPSNSMTSDKEIGLVHLTIEGYNLLVDLLQDQFNRSTNTKEKK